jgi:23S rRNA pseudouridine955/2504/2580 synthase
VRFIDIGPAQAGQRLDNFLLKTLKNLPKSRLYRIIRKGEVRVNKKRIRPDYRLRSGDRLRIPPIRLDDPAAPPVLPEGLKRDIAACILHEDDDLLVLDKPSGLAVHSGSGLRYGAIDVLRSLRPGSDIELVHRLDRDTSGCLLFAFHRRALLALQRQLQSGRMTKIYEAIVQGHWDPALRRVDAPLKRETLANGERRVFVDERGQEAATLIESCEHFSIAGVEYSHLQLRLLTGRTHQIRVHCRSAGHPIVGDDKYGDRERDKAMRRLGARRLMLHARSLEFEHPDGRPVKLLADRPEAFRRLLCDHPGNSQ